MDLRYFNKVIFATFISLISSAVFATDTPISIPVTAPGWEFDASIIYLKPGADNLGWGVVTTVLPIPTPQWRVVTLTPTYQPGFTLGGRYFYEGTGVDFQINWLHLHANNGDAVQVDPATQWISPFSQTGTLPEDDAITGVAKLKTATAQVTFDYDVINVDVGKLINLGSSMQMRVFSGLSAVQIMEELKSNFRGQPQPVIWLNNTSTYRGIGPRIGVNNAYDIYRGIDFVCQFAGSLLIGKAQPAQYKFKATSDDLVIVDIDINREQIMNGKVAQVVPELDAKLGLSYGYTTQRGTKLNFEAGYMGAIYINPLTGYETNTNVIALDSGSLSTASVRHVQSNFSVAGPYLTFNWWFG